MEFDIIISTIDESQEDQHSFCILDLFVHGENRYPMRFIRDATRMNVGGSRAEDGMVVFGYKGMTND